MGRDGVGALGEEQVQPPLLPEEGHEHGGLARGSASSTRRGRLARQSRIRASSKGRSIMVSRKSYFHEGARLYTYPRQPHTVINSAPTVEPSDGGGTLLFIHNPATEPQGPRSGTWERRGQRPQACQETYMTRNPFVALAALVTAGALALGQAPAAQAANVTRPQVVKAATGRKRAFRTSSAGRVGGWLRLLRARAVCLRQSPRPLSRTADQQFTYGSPV